MTGLKHMKFYVHIFRSKGICRFYVKFHTQFSTEALIIKDQLGEKEVSG